MTILVTTINLMECNTQENEITVGWAFYENENEKRNQHICLKRLCFLIDPFELGFN